MAKTDWVDRGPGEPITEENTVDAEAMNALGAEVNAKRDKHIGGVVVAESTVGVPISLLDQEFPDEAVGFLLTIIMPGYGGASGRKGAAGTVRNGGAAAAGAGMTQGLFVPKPAGAHRWHANIPSPGVGGAAVTANDTNGNVGGNPQGGQNGGAYGRVWITDESDAVLWQHFMYPGSVPVGGTNAAMGTTGGGFGLGFVGSTAAAPGNGAAGQASGANGAAGVAGGAGGSISAANTPFNGTPGGWCPATNVSIPAGGVVGGALPHSGLTPSKQAGLPGNGGSGGAASVTGNAQDGGDGAGYGAGGGGGGAATNGVGNSGKGGDGGPGYLSIEWVYE